MSNVSHSRPLYGKAIGIGLLGLAGLAADGLIVTPAQAVTTYDLKAAKKVYDATELASYFKFGSWLSAADLDGDGKSEIVVGSNAGAEDALSYIKLSGDRLTIASTTPLGGGFAGGVRVAAGDVNGDGVADLVVGAASGDSSKVRAGNYVWWQKVKFDERQAGPAAFDHKMGRGITLAIGDFDNTGHNDVVVGATASPLGTTSPPAKIRRASVDVGTSAGSPELTGFIKFRPEYSIYGDSYTGGLRVAAGDVDGDGFDELLTLPESGADRTISFWKHHNTSAGESWEKQHGLSIAKGLPDAMSCDIAIGDVDGDGRAEVVVGSAPGSPSSVQIWSYDFPLQAAGAVGAIQPAWVLQDSFAVLDPSYTGGVSVAIGDVTGDGFGDLIVAPSSAVPEPVTAAACAGAVLFLANRKRRPVRSS